jgi:hypothetical protein
VAPSRRRQRPGHAPPPLHHRPGRRGAHGRAAGGGGDRPALLGSQLHTHIAVKAQRAICKITGSPACGAPGVPKGADSDHTPGDRDRNVYDADTFGHHSYDNSGAELIASINFCEEPGTPTHNAYWDGHQMKFGDGYAASLDVTAHELTHQRNPH